jgi:hypothetical protein
VDRVTEIPGFRRDAISAPDDVALSKKKDCRRTSVDPIGSEQFEAANP